MRASLNFDGGTLYGLSRIIFYPIGYRFGKRVNTLDDYAKTIIDYPTVLYISIAINKQRNHDGKRESFVYNGI